jgi:beta-glucosidase
MAVTKARYADAELDDHTRAADLLAHMTLDEKIAQISGVWVTDVLENLQFTEANARRVLAHGAGQITRIGATTGLHPTENARLANQIQHFLVERTRLSIPAIIHEESCAGYMARGATCFPQPIGLACTWEPRLIEAMAGVIRQQVRAVGGNLVLAPVLDITRDPRWGRTEETFGEDAYLTASMGVAYVRGLQTADLRHGIACTGKHFLGYGMSEGGMNWAPAHINDRELLETYAFPFAAAIREAGLAAIMNAYNEIDGIPVGASRRLLTEILRDQLGFTGTVISDYFTVEIMERYHRAAHTKSEAARLCLEAGLDCELPTKDCYDAPLREAVERGEIALDLIDRAALRMLTQKFALGLFEHPFVDAERAIEVFDTPDQRRLARELAQKSIVLLKNDTGLLPIAPTVKRIAIIGPHADSIRLLQGDYHYPAHVEVMYEQRRLSEHVPMPPYGATISALDEHYPPMFSILTAVKARVSADTTVLHAVGCNVTDPTLDGIQAAVEAAKGAQVALVVLGNKSGLTIDCTAGEARDQAEPTLPGAQAALLQAVVEMGTPVILVLVSGKPVVLPPVVEQVAAIVCAWIPGEEGAPALADILFGEVSPSGKLSMSFPRAAGQIPVFYAHKPSGGRSQWKGDYVDMSAKPLYAFGHGLSYTTFAYRDLTISPAVVRGDEQVTIRCIVQNTGARAADEVVQLYVRDVVAFPTRPVEELRGFLRVSLNPGESKLVTFTLDARQMAFYDERMTLHVQPGQFEVMIGAASDDVRCVGSFEVVGAPVVLDERSRVFFSQVASAAIER